MEKGHKKKRISNILKLRMYLLESSKFPGWCLFSLVGLPYYSCWSGLELHAKNLLIHIFYIFWIFFAFNPSFSYLQAIKKKY